MYIVMGKNLDLMLKDFIKNSSSLKKTVQRGIDKQNTVISRHLNRH